MKIMHLLSSSKFSGAESVAINIINSLTDKYRFYYCSPSGDIEKSLKDYQNIAYVPLNKISLKEVNKKISEIRPDVIHAHDYNASVIAALAYHKIPIISHLHSNNPRVKTKNHLSTLYTILLKRISKVVVVSGVINSEFAFSSLLEKKSIILENVVDKVNIINKADEYGAVESDMIFVGRFSEEKNPIKFIEIVNVLKQKRKNISAIMIGRGTLYKDCELLIKEYGLEDNIKTLGFLENPYPYIRRSKILVAPSLWEGFGLVAIEAMILGKPIISSGAGGLGEIIGHGKNGFICETNMEYASYIDLLLSDPTHYLDISGNCKADVIRYTDTDNYNRKIDYLYTNLATSGDY